MYQLLAIPFLRVCGRSEHAALLVNIPFLGLLIGFTYALVPAGAIDGRGCSLFSW